MIHLVQPTNPRGVASGGYRFNAAIARRLQAAGLGQCHEVSLEAFAAGEFAAATIADDDVLVVDSLFVAQMDPPAWLGTKREQLVLLMHYRPSTDPTRDADWRQGLARRERAWAQLARGAIVTGARLADELSRELGLACTVATPGVGNEFRQSRTGAVDEERPLEVVAVGAVIPTKGQLELVRALEGLASRRPIRLALIGDAQADEGYVQALEDAAGALELRITGNLSSSEVASHLASADLFVAASRFESYGMALAEAAASGVPILAYDVGEQRRWVEPGVDGELVAADDEVGFAQALERLVLSSRPRLGLAAPTRRRFFPTWEYTFGRFLAACQPPEIQGVERATEYSHCNLPTRYGTFRMTVYRQADGEDAVLLHMGMLAGDEPPFVRIHSECFTGEILHSLKCDCGQQLETALQAVADRGRGAVIYLRQEGRGIGLGDKVRAYSQQESGADTVEANQALGLPVDLREFTTAAAILELQGVSRVYLNTNNPDKVVALEDAGLTVVDVFASHSEPNEHSLGYLETKMRRMGHLDLEGALDQLAPSSTASRRPLRLAIFDLDGVIQLGDHVPAEAVRLIEHLRLQGLTLRFLTNDGVNTRAIRAQMLGRHGLHVDPEHIYTGASLTARFLRERHPGSVLALVGEPALQELEGLDLVTTNADAVVVGDYFDHYDPALLRAAFDSLHQGAHLLAIHKKPTWPNEGKRHIDLGFWVAGLEYCAGREATVIAKPAAYSYQAVLNDLGVQAEDAIMISDELDPDLEGARRLGLQTVHLDLEATASSESAGVVRTYEELRRHLDALLPERRSGDDRAHRHHA